jgi:hypothetical protein
MGSLRSLAPAGSFQAQAPRIAPAVAGPARSLCRLNGAPVEFSRSRRYLSTPKKSGESLNIDWLALLDHEYGRDVTPSILERTRSECVQAVEGLYASPILASIMKTDRTGWEIEDLDSGAFSQQFDFRGVPVFVKTDFMFRGGDGTLCIVDWKTNRPAVAEKWLGEEEPRNAAVQLGVYGYYAAHVLREQSGSIRLLEVNLLDNGRVIDHAADDESIARAGETIAAGIAKLASVLVRGDTRRNEALGSEEFPKIENGLCRLCNFYRICKDESYPVRLP